MLRKLFKWLAALLAVVVIAVVVFVWGILGVNPLEGRQEHLWELVSNEVDFFARWPSSICLSLSCTSRRRATSRPAFSGELPLALPLSDARRRLKRDRPPRRPV